MNTFSDEILAKYNITQDELSKIYKNYLLYMRIRNHVYFNHKAYDKKFYCELCDCKGSNFYMHRKCKKHQANVAKQQQESDKEKGYSSDFSEDTISSEEDIILCGIDDKVSDIAKVGALRHMSESAECSKES